jgi:hypothetical protein
MTGGPLTRADVEAAYRFLLGRPPENEAAYAYGLSAGDAETLRRWLLNSREFAGLLRRDLPLPLRRWMLQEMQAAPDAEQGEGPPRIVFLHILKTAGSSLRRRLEELAGGAPVWRHEVDGRPGDAPREALARCRVVMGHFTIADARHVPGPRRIFTVLREPRERLLSYYHFLARHRPEVAARPAYAHAAIARRLPLEKFLADPDPRVQGDLRNAMTRSLAGDYVPVGRNRYRQPWETDAQAISGPELLSRALATLFALDFYGFTDRLEQDRPRLMAALGLPDTGPLPRENTRDLVSDILEQRPPPKVTPVAERLIHRLTDLDRPLYRLARQAAGMR